MTLYQESNKQKSSSLKDLRDENIAFRLKRDGQKIDDHVSNEVLLQLADKLNDTKQQFNDTHDKSNAQSTTKLANVQTNKLSYFRDHQLGSVAAIFIVAIGAFNFYTVKQPNIDEIAHNNEAIHSNVDKTEAKILGVNSEKSKGRLKSKQYELEFKAIQSDVEKLKRRIASI